MQESTFKIYNASAGSGKTFTLVKEYLKIILSSNKYRGFQQILAVTFTNKAVNEMKARILDSLFDMSRSDHAGNSEVLASILQDELGLSRSELQSRSEILLKNILHNYAFFDISTIDKFTHRVLRSFARDLKLSHNFEVVLDIDLLLREAVYSLLANTGSDKQLTEALVDFAVEKADEDKHWDLNRDLLKVGEMLFSENDKAHLRSLKEKNFPDYKNLQDHLKKEINRLGREASKKGEFVLNQISESGRPFDIFPRKMLPNHFNKIKAGNFDLEKLYNNKLGLKISEGNILKVRTEPLSEELFNTIATLYWEIKELLYRRAFLLNIYQNLVPLTVLKVIDKHLREIESSRDLLPISSFNSIIENSIANQPAPFIYERLGEKYRHYFIDEFQDTSEMQWKNLIPLVANALESMDEDGNYGSLLLVGDVKQAIYRWRGGKPEQFLDLITGRAKPFVIDPKISNLETNYRSAENIVAFNNAFFKSTSSLLSQAVYSKLFEKDTQQLGNTLEGGLVRIDFIDCEKESLDDHYLDSIYQIIEEVGKKGYSLKDICILTRKKDQGVLISEGLVNKEIPVVSSDTLLLSSSPEVLFLINLLRATRQPGDKDIIFEIVRFLIPKMGDAHFHQVFWEAASDLEVWLNRHWDFNLNSIRFLSVYDGLEYAIAKFGLMKTSDAFVTSLLDEVFRIEQKTDSGIDTFLNHWTDSKEKLSVKAPEDLDAVKIMTIHKAKGLEFPVVIYPYANADFYVIKDESLWFKTDPEEFMGFSELPLRKKKQMLEYGEKAARLYQEDQDKMQMDAFNLLYVALTRAVNALYVLTEKDLDPKGKHKDYKISGLFIHYLRELNLWSDEKGSYDFGVLSSNQKAALTRVDQQLIPYVYSTKTDSVNKLVVRKNSLWDDPGEAARERGKLMHHFMSLIHTPADIEQALLKLRNQGIVGDDQIPGLRAQATKVVEHPEIAPFFREGLEVKNEKEIIGENGLILRPDRLVFEGSNITVIDYKTGIAYPEYKDQLMMYRDAIMKMGYSVTKSMIIYINETITTENIH